MSWAPVCCFRVPPGEAQKDGMTGFEFAAGIPGTVGGAAVMNAGAYGGELKDVLESVRVMTPDGKGKRA